MLGTLRTAYFLVNNSYRVELIAITSATFVSMRPKSLHSVSLRLPAVFRLVPRIVIVSDVRTAAWGPRSVATVKEPDYIIINKLTLRFFKQS